MDYQLFNTAHARHNRTARAALPKNPRMKQYVGDKQHRLIAGRPVIVSEEMVKRNIEELKAKAAAHMIEVRTRDGRLVDLNTMEPAPPAPATVFPHPLMDSVANDKTFVYPPGWKFVPPNASADGVMPQVLKEGEKPSLFADAVPEDLTPAVTAPAVVEEPAVVTTDAELEAALAEAQSEAATTVEEGVVSTESTRRDRSNRRSR
jgi:hypothetical protein